MLTESETEKGNGTPSAERNLNKLAMTIANRLFDQLLKEIVYYKLDAETIDTVLRNFNFDAQRIHIILNITEVIRGKWM